MAVEALAVANYFLDKGKAEKRRMESLKLNKLVIIAHGWYLAIRGEPLIRNEVRAWTYGPMIPEIEEEFSLYEGRMIERKVKFYDFARGEYRHWVLEDFVETEADLREIRRILDQVWNLYGSYTTRQLCALAHDDGSPWDQVAGHLPLDEPRDLLIPNKLQEEYYISVSNEKHQHART